MTPFRAAMTARGYPAPLIVERTIKRPGDLEIVTPHLPARRVEGDVK